MRSRHSDKIKQRNQCSNSGGFRCAAHTIASILGSLDEKIEVNRRKIKKLEALARLIYEHWFVQFDFPDANGRPYKSSGGKMEWNDELKQEIPVGWKATAFTELVKIEKDSVSSDMFRNRDVEHYSIPIFDEQHWPLFENGSNIESNKFRVSKDTFLVSKLNPQFKRIWNPPCVSNITLCSTEFMVIKPHNVRMKPYCYAVADSQSFYDFMVSQSSSSTGSRKRFPSENIQFFYFPSPKSDSSAIVHFNEMQNNILEKLIFIRCEIRNLIVLRDWLLPMLMNGQVSVDA